MRKKFNYHIGALFRRFGYQVAPRHKVPQCTLNIMLLGVGFLQMMKDNLTVVQIGAFDGEVSDPLEAIISKNRNQILLVEPQQKPYEKLVKRYGDCPNIKIENCAITPDDGEVCMHLPKDEEFSPKASVNPDHMRNFAIHESDIRQIKVKSLSAASLLRNHGIDEIDVLQIDTEGLDYQILSQFFSLNVEPAVLNLEILHLSEHEMNSLRMDLQRLGYLYIEYGIDVFAIKRVVLESLNIGIFK